LSPGATSVWAQYTVVAEGQREALREALTAAGVPTQVYYPIPMHRQTAYSHFPGLPEGLPVSESLSRSVLSLPFHPYLRRDEQDEIAAVIRKAA
jgi:dTDP-4-amino-4,6-dideoxygalactose transaminase